MIRLPSIAAAVLVWTLSPALAEPASRTEDLLGLLGISGHVAEYKATYSDPTITVADAQYLGIRHWRDGMARESTYQLEALRSLVKAGISLIALPHVPAQPQNASVSENIALAKRVAALGPDALFAIEGANEPKYFPLTYNGVSTGPAGHPNTFVPVAQFQRDYYAAIKADSTLANVPVWSNTLIGTEPDNAGLQFLKIPTPAPSGVLLAAGTAFADVANIHLYPMWNQSAQSVDPLVGNMFKGILESDFVDTWEKHFEGYTADQARALPKVVSEFGYRASGGTPGGVTTDIPTQGKNILNGLMNAWAEGYTALTIYTLYDTSSEPGFGLFWSPGAPRDSGKYLHNFVKALEDTGANARSFTPWSTGFFLSGLPSTARWRVFQKSNGNFYFVLWNNVTNWNMATGWPITIAPTNVTITFVGTPSVVNIYDPVAGSGPSSTVVGLKTVTATLRDYPIIVEAAGI
jgi:hypothetical protein